MAGAGGESPRHPWTRPVGSSKTAWDSHKEPIMTKNVVQQIRRATRRQFTSEEKIRIVLEGLRGEISVAELCRREGISPTVYYRWSKDFLEAGKNGLVRDTRRDATADEVRDLKAENEALKRALAEAVLDVMRLKKSLGL